MTTDNTIVERAENIARVGATGIALCNADMVEVVALLRLLAAYERSEITGAAAVKALYERTKAQVDTPVRRIVPAWVELDHELGRREAEHEAALDEIEAQRKALLEGK